MQNFLLLLMIGLANISILVHDFLPHHHHINGLVHRTKYCDCHQEDLIFEGDEDESQHEDSDECTVSDGRVFLPSKQSDVTSVDLLELLPFEINNLVLPPVEASIRIYQNYDFDKQPWDPIVDNSRRGPPYVL